MEINKETFTALQIAARFTEAHQRAKAAESAIKDVTHRVTITDEQGKVLNAALNILAEIMEANSFWSAQDHFKKIEE